MPAPRLVDLRVKPRLVYVAVSEVGGGRAGLYEPVVNEPHVVTDLMRHDQAALFVPREPNWAESAVRFDTRTRNVGDPADIRLRHKQMNDVRAGVLPPGVNLVHVAIVGQPEPVEFDIAQTRLVVVELAGPGER